MKIQILVAHKISGMMTVVDNISDASMWLGITYERCRQITKKNNGESKNYIIRKIENNEEINNLKQNYCYVECNI